MLSLPAAVGLILLREPLVTMLYQRGAFDQRSTGLVAWPLLWYAAGLVGHAIVEILSPRVLCLARYQNACFSRRLSHEPEYWI